MRFLIAINNDERELLSKPIKGDGGFQRLLKRLRRTMLDERGGWFISVSPEDAERIVRYGTEYGGGGFQLRLPHEKTKAKTNANRERERVAPGHRRGTSRSRKTRR